MLMGESNALKVWRGGGEGGREEGTKLGMVLEV